MTNQHRDRLMAYLDAYNCADWQRLALHVSTGYVHHSGDQTRDLAGFIQGATWLRNGFPDLAIEVQDIFGEGDRAAVRFVIRGTHSASLLGEEPTSGEVALDGIMIYRFEDELIAEDWEGMDEGQLRRQLGL